MIINILCYQTIRYYSPNLAVMRIVSFMLVLGLIPCFGFGQNQIRGKIVDELGFPIYRASIQLHATDSVVYTDFDGSFSLSSEKDFHWKINIQSQGYQTETFFVLEGGSTGAIVLEYDMDMKAILEENGSDYE